MTEKILEKPDPLRVRLCLYVCCVLALYVCVVQICTLFQPHLLYDAKRGPVKGCLFVSEFKENGTRKANDCESITEAARREIPRFPVYPEDDESKPPSMFVAP